MLASGLGRIVAAEEADARRRRRRRLSRLPPTASSLGIASEYMCVRTHLDEDLSQVMYVRAHAPICEGTIMTDHITRTELEALIAAGEVVLVDALPASYYDQVHLPGALNLVEDEVDATAAALLPDKNGSDRHLLLQRRLRQQPGRGQPARAPRLHERPQVPRGHPGLGRGRQPHRVDPPPDDSRPHPLPHHNQGEPP